MSRPRLLDLFCGAGGAAMGYHRAGFEVVGVDINPQPHYPFKFIQADAMTYPLEGFDAIHASPPCQAYSSMTAHPVKHPDLYLAIRNRLYGAGVPFIIENVIGAPYGHGIILCGSTFGLSTEGEWLRRHRNFETSFLMFQPSCQHQPTKPITITSSNYVTRTGQWTHSRQPTFALAQALMQIDWMTRRELGQAIPPAYTEFISTQLIRAVSGAAKRYPHKASE